MSFLNEVFPLTLWPWPPETWFLFLFFRCLCYFIHLITDFFVYPSCLFRLKRKLWRFRNAASNFCSYCGCVYFYEQPYCILFSFKITLRLSLLDCIFLKIYINKLIIISMAFLHTRKWQTIRTRRSVPYSFETSTSHELWNV